jgi:SAM-dependent methyltransferase
VIHDFDRGYWESHWQQAADRAPVPAHPYLDELVDLSPGTALDAGCGEGAEAVWLARRGWQVTAVDISADVLERAAARAQGATGAGGIDWVRADLSTWSPRVEHDLVATHYAHPAMPQLAFYARVAQWVAPGGTLLVVGHRDAHAHATHARSGHGHGSRDHGGAPPAHATVAAAQVVALLDPAQWHVVTAAEPDRAVARPGGGEHVLRDVVVRAERRGHLPR